MEVAHKREIEWEENTHIELHVIRLGGNLRGSIYQNATIRVDNLSFGLKLGVFRGPSSNLNKLKLLKHIKNIKQLVKTH